MWTSLVFIIRLQMSKVVKEGSRTIFLTFKKVWRDRLSWQSRIQERCNFAECTTPKSLQVISRLHQNLQCTGFIHSHQCSFESQATVLMPVRQDLCQWAISVESKVTGLFGSKLGLLEIKCGDIFPYLVQSTFLFELNFCTGPSGSFPFIILVTYIFRAYWSVGTYLFIPS